MRFHCIRSFILLFLVASLFYACGPKGSDTAEVNIDVDAFKSYAIDVNASKTPIFELIESVELMMLEETDESLLSYVTYMEEADDGFVFTSRNEGDIYFYTKEGQYKSKINRQGDGPEEYSEITSYWVERQMICVYTRKSATVKCYDFQGNFKKENKLSDHGDQLIPYRNGYVMDMGGSPVQDSLNYYINMLDSSFNTDTLLLSFDVVHQVSFSSTLNGFKAYKEGLTYLRTQGDSVFYLNGNAVKPLMHFDFGSQWLWNDEKLLDDNQGVFEAMQTRGLVWGMGVKVGERWVYLTYLSDYKDAKGLMVNRYSGKYYLLDKRNGIEQNYTIVGLQWMGDRLLMSIGSDEVADFLSELEDDQWRFRNGTTLEAIESSEHRAMMWVKFRDSTAN